jgi:hypothetical protein
LAQYLTCAELRAKTKRNAYHTLPPSAGVDGLLGLDFLRGMRFTADFRAGALTLE